MPPRSRSKHLASVTQTTAALLQEEQLEKSRQALALRREGKDWWEIADQMRLTPTGVREAVAYGIKAASDLVSDGTKAEMLQLELMRLDALTQANWGSAMRGDVQKGKFVLDIIKERVRLLELDTATAQAGQTTVVVGGTTEEYLAALVAISEMGKRDPDVVKGELETGTA